MIVAAMTNSEIDIMKTTIEISATKRKPAIKELTVRNKRDMLKARELFLDEGAEFDTMEMLLADDGLFLSDLSTLTDLTSEEIDELTDSDIDKIMEESKRLNPRFFSQVLGAIQKFVEVEKNLREIDQSSKETSSPSSSRVM